MSFRSTTDAVRKQVFLPEEQNTAGEGKMLRRQGVCVFTCPTAIHENVWA